MGAIKNIFAEHKLQELLANRRAIQKKISEFVDMRTDCYGIKILNVGIQSIRLPKELERDLSVVAESGKLALANIVNSKSGFESAKLFTESAEEYAKNPISFQLMYFET